ncbi:deoxynucleoside triphosphate triphosphohydrolase SAMHD1-like [Quillaja saponaria]|uniref:Deoxynucleoside triphosphate triphosphohydrolase SAMHD1-like n=1 Tax=Quillaja saponaria TaxID=32244 RepID=A0AAD7PG40_QUISA|nr:deoxynucleoside triphosphate triphosphohydrolase SAMHD1-like [Quillaja saponaria]
MGASFEDNVSLERPKLKHFCYNVYGSIFLEPKYMDDSSFLGLSHMVYPGDVHSLLEHSLKLYNWLAGKGFETIKKYQVFELENELSDVHTVKLAGLLHDLGHGPFSHMIECRFLLAVLKGSEWSHEDMSVKIDYIVDQHHIDIDSESIKKVKGMNGKCFLYDIVASGRNGIDVDKFDYIVCDSHACDLGCNFQSERSNNSQVICNSC